LVILLQITTPEQENGLSSRKMTAQDGSGDTMILMLSGNVAVVSQGPAPPLVEFAVAALSHVCPPTAGGVSSITRQGRTCYSTLSTELERSEKTNLSFDS